MKKASYLRTFLKQAVLLYKAVETYQFACGTHNTSVRCLAELAIQKAGEQLRVAIYDFEEAFNYYSRNESRPAEHAKMLEKTWIIRKDFLQLAEEKSLSWHHIDLLLRLYALYVGFTTSHNHARFNKKILAKGHNDCLVTELFSRFFSSSYCPEDHFDD